MERKARWLEKQSSLKRILEADSASHRRHIDQLIPDQEVAHRVSHAASQKLHNERAQQRQAQVIRDEAIKYVVEDRVCRVYELSELE